jgi:hypothetical protein
MFQFRFVILALLIPAAGVAAILGGTGPLHSVVMPPYDAASSATASAAFGVIAQFASVTIDAAARAASDVDVAAALAKGELTPKAEAALLTPAGVYGAPSFALLVNVSGTIVARSGAPSKLPDSLGGLPVVAEALTGVSRDGLWIEDDKPVHLAAAAIYDGAAPAGGVVLGWAFSPSLAETFAREVGVPTVIGAGAAVIGTLPEGIDAAAVVAREPAGEPSRVPSLVPDIGRFLIGVRPLYPSEPRFTINTIVDRDAAFVGLAQFQTVVLVGTLFLLALVLGIIVSTLRSMNRPLELITDHLSQVQQGNNVGILPEAGLGPMLRLGKQINMLLQSMPSARPGTAPLFGASTSQDVPAPSFGDPAPRVPSQPFPPAPIAPVAPFVPAAPMVSTPPRAPTPAPFVPSMPPVAADAGFARPAQSGLAGLFDDGPDPLAAFRVANKPATPPAPPPPAPAPVRPEPEPELHEMQPEATVMFQVPESLLAASAAPSPPPAPLRAAPVSAPSPVDDNRTVVAQVPQELLAQVSPKNDVDAADDAHYKEVYEKFVQTRIECGEDTSDLSYDRFVAKLLKNRQQIVEKHKARSVRFQVYAKDGKAALRALPVRD